MTPDDRDPVDVLAEEFASRLRRGEHPAVSEYAARHPELAEQLQEVLPAVAQMEQLKLFRRAEPADAVLPDRLGDFRIVRELGRGGMGIVFEAVQESLGRPVALKVLSGAGHLDRDRRERFIREAKAAARLHHSNIVPVFGVGQHGGLPYYAMQLIPGCGLDAVVGGWHHQEVAADAESARDHNGSTLTIRKCPAGRKRQEPAPLANGPEYGDWAFVTHAGIQVAEALQYAHEHGVLHRDVKPANLLLDGDQRVWVVDFGLAKMVDHHGLTATGDVVGTLQYMAPECLHGEADARSDVYGLGATLYELLARKPAFQLDSPIRLMQRLMNSDPPAPRSINPDIPQDLETIVLTALAREPGQRYASAADLADDLRAFLDDQPIRARRQTTLGRAARWCRRNPAIATLSLSTLAAAVLAAVVGWVGYARTKAALTGEARAAADARASAAAEATRRAEAEEASAKLAANLDLSLQAFETVFKAASGSEGRPEFGRRLGPPPPTPEMAEKAAMLEAVLAFYDQFARQNETNEKLRFEAAKGYRRAAEVNERLGRAEKAVAAYHHAEELLTSLAPDAAPAEDIRYELMLALGHWWADEPRLLRAAALGDGFTGSRRWAVGAVYLRLGWLRESHKKPTDAASAYRTAVELLTPGRDDPPQSPRVLIDRTTARQRLAAVVAESSPEEARQALHDAISEIGPFGRGPENQLVRNWLAEMYQQLAAVLTRLGDFGGANAARAQANWILGVVKGLPGPRPGGPGGSPPPKPDRPFPNR